MEFHTILGRVNTGKGRHNDKLKESIEDLNRLKPYDDLSTIIICPTKGMISAQVVEAWMHLMRPINQKVRGPIFIIGKEVGEAYNEVFLRILTDPFLVQYKYVLTIEDDNLPPPNGLLKLYESMDKYDVVGGLYWSKGEFGFPLMFGNPKSDQIEYKIQSPVEGEVVEVNALGMGFTLFKLDMFREIEEPWFKTVQQYSDDIGSIVRGQDVYFFEKAKQKGFKFAVDCRVLVGHIDDKGIIW